jgi:hypothetical protein
MIIRIEQLEKRTGGLDQKELDKIEHERCALCPDNPNLYAEDGDNYENNNVLSD